MIERVQPKMVKIFGGGGLKRLESWQSGFFVSSDGLIATAWSYVLDSQPTVVLDSGQRLTAELVGYHPQYEIALLRVSLAEQDWFNLDDAGQALVGTSVVAFSNLYGVAAGNEKCSVQTGLVSALVPLDARRGTRKANYQGPAIVLDATTNNPGAAGGAVTDEAGRLLGMIGRESRSAESELWLNYAIPAEQVSIAVDLILAGQTDGIRSDAGQPGRRPTEPMTLSLMGLVLVPDVVERTPPFVDQVLAGSAAEVAGLQVDDLIVQVNDKVTASCKGLLECLESIDRDGQLSIMVQRGDDFVNLSLRVIGK